MAPQTAATTLLCLSSGIAEFRQLYVLFLKLRGSEEGTKEESMQTRIVSPLLGAR